MPSKYSKEQELFILENADKVSRKQLLNEFNKHFHTDMTYSAITQKCKALGVENKIQKATDNQIQYLIDNYMSMSWNELRDNFNSKFHTNMSVKGLNRLLYERGYRKYNRHHFTDEQREFLIENLPRYSYPKLTEMFNEKYGTDCTQGSITQQCLSFLNIAKGETYIPHNVMEVGDEVTKYKSSRYAKTYIKVRSGCKKNRNKMWKPKQTVLWEKHNRPLKDDEIVIFLDGNRENFEIDNLYCITRKIMSIMNLNRWFTDSKEHTLTAIKWCELLYAMKNTESV